jgi:hypothetical protein
MEIFVNIVILDCYGYCSKYGFMVVNEISIAILNQVRLCCKLTVQKYLKRKKITEKNTDLKILKNMFLHGELDVLRKNGFKACLKQSKNIIIKSWCSWPENQK